MFLSYPSLTNVVRGTFRLEIEEEKYNRMSKRNEGLLETSIYSTSEHLPDPNRRLSKRFRPLVQCNHIDKLTNEQCPADGFMECVHCDQICCLNHITQHQEELRQLRDDLVQVCSLIVELFLFKFVSGSE